MGLKSQPKIIVVRPRRKKSSGGHHGGSWKVAYADFVTAMMAFFMVMWIVSMDDGVKDVVEGYFNNPVGFKRGYANGSSPAFSGSNPAATPPRPITNPDGATGSEAAPPLPDQAELEAAAAQIRTGVEQLELQGVEAEISVAVTAEGLRVEMAEGAEGETFFEFGSANPEAALERVLALVGESLAALPNSIVIEGHTDAAPYPRAGYTNWELSVDRANTARRMLTTLGVAEERVLEVRGYADRQLRYPDEPRNPANRRVTLFVTSSPESSGAAAAGAIQTGGDPG